MQAQFHFGAKAAYSLSFARAKALLFDDQFDYLKYEIIFQDEDVLPMFGIIGIYEQEKVFVQTEILYKRTRSTFKAIDWRTVDRFTYVETKMTDYLVTPFMAGYKKQNLTMGLGPIFSWIVNENQIFDVLEDFEERREILEMGFGFNIGVNLYKLHIDINYETHFNRLGDYFIFEQVQSGFGQSPGYFSLGLAYMVY